jgi:hypothetical protein
VPRRKTTSLPVIAAFAGRDASRSVKRKPRQGARGAGLEAEAANVLRLTSD